MDNAVQVTTGRQGTMHQRRRRQALRATLSVLMNLLMKHAAAESSRGSSRVQGSSGLSVLFGSLTGSSGLSVLFGSLVGSSGLIVLFGSLTGSSGLSVLFGSLTGSSGLSVLFESLIGSSGLSVLFGSLNLVVSV
jgi:hypothetical protein